MSVAYKPKLQKIKFNQSIKHNTLNASDNNYIFDAFFIHKKRISKYKY